MSVVSSQNATLYLDQHNLTGYLKEIDAADEYRTLNKTVLGDAGVRHALSLQSSGLTVRALWDRTTGGSYDVLQAAFKAAGQKLATHCPEGPTVGYPAEMIYGHVTKFDDSVKIADLTSIAAELKSEQRGIEYGVALHGSTTEGTGGNGAAVDNAASSAGGGVAHLHATLNPIGSSVVKVQHSADNSVWADLITFSTVNAPTSQRVEVAGTINRYIRATWSVGGPSLGFIVAFARR